jgi:hypothetical protein
MAVDPKFAASLIEQLGGKIVEHESLRFDLPLRDVERVVPQLNALNIGCRRIQEWTTTDHRGPISVVRIACTNTPAGKVRGEIEHSTLQKFGF